MEEKPHVLLLGVNSKSGKHFFNFNKYKVRLNYQFSSQGVVIEVYPPHKKKQIDYNYFTSPYNPDQNLQLMKFKLNRRNIINQNEKCIKKPKGNDYEKKKEILRKVKKNANKTEELRKCVIQEVYNFSEIPQNTIKTYFPYEGSGNQQILGSCLFNQFHTVGNNLQNRTGPGGHNRIGNMELSLSKNLMPSVSDTVATCSNNLRLNKEGERKKSCKSNIEISPDYSNYALRKRNSITKLQDVVHKLQKQNESLQRKLATVERSYL